MFRKSNNNVSAIILYIIYYWNVCCDFSRKALFYVLYTAYTYVCTYTAVLYRTIEFFMYPRVKYMYNTSEDTSRVPHLGFFRLDDFFVCFTRRCVFGTFFFFQMTLYYIIISLEYYYCCYHDVHICNLYIVCVCVCVMILLWLYYI